ncbi:ATP-dependent DNA helicase PIF1-like [Montipora foliosa]|uniref:ATP-dependent DNA helicase PIF1-like n=1 Tax=Montipora foliosa TaxID=591990 RepID=UPI0035F1E739
MRQNLADKTILNALKKLRLGKCSPETDMFLKSLDRPLEGDSVDIFFTKLSVQLHNQESLYRLPGELLTFSCIDEGNVSGINCPADVKLLLKEGVKVMTLWNISVSAKNGTSGRFVGVKDDKREVEVLNHECIFETSDLVQKRQVWKGNWKRHTVLFYACTCHKTQGLTLPLAVVHCSKEFVSGVLYVAISRVCHPDHLRVLMH